MPTFKQGPVPQMALKKLKKISCKDTLFISAVSGIPLYLDSLLILIRVATMFSNRSQKSQKKPAQ